MWNLPNIVTLGRLTLLPVVMALIWPGIVTPCTAFIAGWIYVVGGILDGVDGMLARSRGEVTTIGKLLDPLADKFYSILIMVALVQHAEHWMPSWILMLTILRELSITGLRGIAASEGVVIAASGGGKTKTVLSIIGTAFLVGHYPFSLKFLGIDYALPFYELGLTFTLLALIFSLGSALQYIMSYWHASKRRHS